MKVLAACGSGMGSSQIIKMKITNVFRKIGVSREDVLKHEIRANPALFQSQWCVGAFLAPITGLNLVE